MGQQASVINEGDASHGIAASIGRWAGPIAGAALAWWTHPAGAAHGGLTADGAITLGLLAWMALWWMTQAADLAVTALIPAVLLPVLGIVAFKDVAASYADNVIFLFAGGTVLGMALERHGISEHFVHWMLKAAGTRPAFVVGALFMAAASVSAFVSNTATTVLMLPLATGVAAGAVALPDTAPERAARGARNFTTAALLAIAFGSTVGGGATLIGSPPNAIAANYLRAEGVAMDFGAWARFGVPIALAMCPVAILAIVRMLPAHGIALPPRRREDLPPIRPAGWATLAIFVAAVFVWVTSSSWPAGWKPAGLTDGGVAIAAAILLMVLPARDGSQRAIVPWSMTRDLPWGVFILFGGGLAIGDAMQRTGLSQTIGQSLAGLGALPSVAVIGSVVLAMAFASEIGSNTALTATAVPILGAMAPALGIPVTTMAVATAFGASYAFMLPVGTPPNALVFATGKVPHGAMVRVGLVLDLAGAVVITVMLWILS